MTWEVRRLREVLVELVKQVVAERCEPGALDKALTEATLVLRMTADEKCTQHSLVHDVGWSYCRVCSFRVMADPPPSPADLAREAAEMYGDDDRGSYGGRE